MRRIEIVAEIGINHQGDMNLAAHMIRSAKRCGADVAKFQIYTPSVILDPTHPLLAPWWAIIEATELDLQKARMLKRICDEEGIEFLDGAELLYLSRDGRKLINTLPASIQAEVDREVLSQVATTLGRERCGV